MTAHLTSFREVGLFTGVPQFETFSNFKNLLPVRRMDPSSSPQQWEAGEPLALPAEFPLGDRFISLQDFLAESDTTALFVLRDGRVRFEEYRHTAGRDVQWISMSVAKSFVSALVGILVDDGKVRSIDDPISDYIRVEKGSAYDGVSIRDVLLMSSGGRWNEDYSDPQSDVQQLLDASRGDLDGFVASAATEREPGTLCRYNSADTQALGALVRAASGQSLSAFMQERLVEPLGFEQPGYWWIDELGVEAAFGGLNLTARDFARLGELYRNRGVSNGSRVLSEEWIDSSTTVTAPQCDPAVSDLGIGYGFQWWLPVNDHGAYVAVGVYNQFIWVDPATKTTIVKLGATQQYGRLPSGEGGYTMENLAFLSWLGSLEF